MTRVLIVEDDNVHAEHIEHALRDMGIDYLHAQSAEEAITLSEKYRIRLYLIDIELPGISGFTFARTIRGSTNAPVIFMGDIDDEAQKVCGFGLGADDYLVKPFGMLELSCRIRAVLRRCEAQKCVDYRNIKMNITDHSVLINGEKIKLTPTEFSLLFELVMAGGKVVGKKSLIRNVWGAESSASDHTLKESIRRLRKKIGKDAIDSVYGEGFIFVPEQ